MFLPPELVGLIDYLPTWSGSVRCVALAISAMTSSQNDDKDAVLPDQEGIAWDETGAHSKYTKIYCMQMFTNKRAGVASGSLLTTSCVSSSTKQRSGTNGTLGAAKSQLRSQRIA